MKTESLIKLPVTHADHEWNIVDANERPLCLVAQCVNDPLHRERIARATAIVNALNGLADLVEAAEAVLRDVATGPVGTVTSSMRQLRAALAKHQGSLKVAQEK